jgi:hypothetical protein
MKTLTPVAAAFALAGGMMLAAFVSALSVVFNLGVSA